MKKFFSVVAVLLLVASMVTVAYAADDMVKCATCAVAKVDGGWCDDCGKGYVKTAKGVKVTECEICFEEMQKPEGMCDDCGKSFISGIEQE